MQGPARQRLVDEAKAVIAEHQPEVSVLLICAGSEIALSTSCGLTQDKAPAFDEAEATWRKLSERTRRIFLLLSMHVTTFSIVVTPTLGKVLIFLDFTNYSPYGKVESYTYNFSYMSLIANHFAHLKVPFSSTDP